MKKNNYCTIYIVRHGESEANVAGLHGLDTPLTQKGKEQAKELLKQLKGIHFDAIFSSPLVRAKETAAIIAKEHKLIVLSKEALRERNEGILSGKEGKKMQEEFKEMYQMRQSIPYDEWKTKNIAEGYETDESLMSRFITACREIAIAYPAKTILIGSHVGIMKTLLVHLGLKEHKDVPGGAFENTGYIKLKTDGSDIFVEEIVGLKEKSQQK